MSNSKELEHCQTPMERWEKSEVRNEYDGVEGFSTVLWYRCRICAILKPTWLAFDASNI